MIETPGPVGRAQGSTRDDSDDPFALAVGRRRSSALTRVGGKLGQDPREAAKLMKTNSFFVEVERLSSRNLVPSGSTAAGAQPVSARRYSDLAGHRHRGNAGNSTTKKQRGVSAAFPGSRPIVHAPVSTPACSSGGYAFSCDPQAQQAEIAMILGERPAPMHQTANFYEQRSSLRAQRIGRARHSISGEEKRGDNEAVGQDSLGQAATHGTRNGLAGLAPLQCRNPLGFSLERSSSASSLTGRGSGSREGCAVDALETSGNHVQEGSWAGLGREEMQVFPPLQLIVEEKLPDDGDAVSPRSMDHARQGDHPDLQRKPSS